MGSDSIALPLLNELTVNAAESLEWVGVFTQPDRPSGRGMKVRAGVVKQWAETQNIPVLQPHKLSSAELEWLKETGCSLIIVMAYGHILKQSLLDIPKFGSINVHASLLPAYRGASPIEAAVANGESVTGMSLMRVWRRLDAGPVLDQESISIDSKDTSSTVKERLSQAAIPLIRRNLTAIISGKAIFEPQNEDAATYTRLLRKSDGILNFDNSAKCLVNRVRALCNWPGAYFEVAGVRLRIGKASCDNAISESASGTIMKEGNHLFITATSGRLHILELQKPGGRMLPIADFLRGYNIENGTVVKDGAMTKLSAKPTFRES